MSRSSVTLRNSRRSRHCSSASVVRCPCPRNASAPSAVSSLRQRRSTVSLMPRLRATSARPRPACCDSFTASSLNARSNCRRFRFPDPIAHLHPEPRMLLISVSIKPGQAHYIEARNSFGVRATFHRAIVERLHSSRPKGNLLVIIRHLGTELCAIEEHTGRYFLASTRRRFEHGFQEGIGFTTPK